MQRLSMTAALGAAVVAAGSLIAFTGISNAAQHPAAATPAAVSSGWYGAAPYVMPLDNNPPNLPQVMAATGQKTFELAFVLSDGGCNAAWGGTASVSSDSTVANIISGVRAAGGDVSVSFGGYGGTKLGQVCGSASATAAAEQAVISKYQLKAIDFDLEEPEYENTAAINNEIGAAQILQNNNPGLYVSITTAGTTAGTGYFGQNVLNTAKSDNFVPANYSIMPFDGGFNGAASQTAALESFHTLLMNTFGWNSATAYNHEGVSQMNGRTDSAEYFYQSDFQSVLSYAQSKGLTRYTYWSLNRDVQCNPPDNNGQLSGTCSSVPQNSWDFTKYTAEFGGAVPPTSPPPPPPTSPPPGGSCSASAWVATTAYTGGQQVSYNGHTWTAKWWTENDTPGGPAGVWTDNGSC
ncbi:MAG TPA: carbohydrate-binding protein [Pseudonocardiaceae bacterium]